MTKQLKSGEDKTHHKEKQLEDHIGAEFSIKGEEGQWSGSEIEVKSDPLIDNIKSDPVILRSFYFKANPEIMKEHKPTKQMILNNHVKQIEMMLWGDGLEVMPEVNPKIILSKKRDEYKIFITCKPRKGVIINELPLSLEDIMKSKHATTNRR